MHDIAMAALPVSLMQPLALLAPAPPHRHVQRAGAPPWERGRPARTRPEAGNGRPAEGPPVC